MCPCVVHKRLSRKGKRGVKTRKQQGLRKGGVEMKKKSDGLMKRPD